MSRPHYHFITGRLAESSLRDVVTQLAKKEGFAWSIEVLPITVAALMTPRWVARKMQGHANATEIVLPGFCDGDLVPVQNVAAVPVTLGPYDLHMLPEFFGRQSETREGYGDYSIEVLAEINHAPQHEMAKILSMAKHLAADGADLIDVGCDPGMPWSGVGDCVKRLRDAGHRVSVDSFHRTDVDRAVRAGAELVLSVNSSNVAAAADWGCEVVVVPDHCPDLQGLDKSVEQLTKGRIPFRIDPIIEPIGFGFADSLGRFLEVRRRYPDTEMLMGIGNLTELTDCDSAAVNTILLGFCQELRIHSVLTTQVINWARSSVKECDLARRLMHYAVQKRRLPKHLEPNLVLLRDEKVFYPLASELEQLSRQLKDHNYRLFADLDHLHVVSSGLHIRDADPFVLFDKLLQSGPKNVDASHAFYLGYELAKAQTARTLGKQYQQDQALDWGFLTRNEESHRQRKQKQTDGKSS